MTMSTETSTKPFWPPKYNILGVNVSATTYEDELDSIVQAAHQRRSACVSHLAVHGLTCAATDSDMSDKLNQFEIIAPDGRPVKAALNLMYRTQLKDNVRGPELTLRICERASRENIKVYIYGSTSETIELLCENLLKKFPTLQIAGREPSVFRPLTQEEDQALVQRINQSGAGIVLVGLGCPRQEQFAFEHKNKIHAVQICVGAAFDFHAGNKKMAPEWMQKNYLEWLYRLYQEPKRLWKRYMYTNSLFLLLLSRQYFLKQMVQMKSFVRGESIQ